METKTKIGVVIALIAILILAFFIAPNISGAFTLNENSELTTVRMGSLPVIHGLPVYLAIEKGYFKEAGINLELVKLESPTQIIDGIMQDKLDFTSTSGASGISAVANYKNPGKLKIYALSGGTSEHPSNALIVPIDSDVNSFSDLKGKKLGIIGGSIQWKILARYLLEKNGLIVDKDVTIVEIPISTHVTAIASKQIDALLTLEPAVSTIIQNKVGKKIEGQTIETQLTDPFYGGAGIVNAEFASKNPETTKKIIEIIKRAQKEIESNPNEARKYLVGYTPLNEELSKVVTLAVVKTCDELNTKDKEGLSKFYGLFTDYNVVSGIMDPSNVLYCN